MVRRSSDETEAFWRDLIAEQGDQTVEQICKWAGVSTASFYAWKRRLRRAPAKRATKSAPDAGMFVPVQLLSEPPSRAVTEITIELPQGFVLRIPSGCDLPTVDVAVHAVRALTRTGDASC